MTRILVTGAAGGIGTAICRALAQEGASVLLHSQSERSAVAELQHSLAGTGHERLQADLGDPVAIERMWKQACEHGRVDAVVNNAGIFPAHPPLSTDYPAWVDAWRRTLAVNLAGPAHLSFFAARAMAAAGGGRIVNVSSRAAFRGELTAPAYAASKSGLNAFSQSLAKALAGRGVCVFVVAPGWVSTSRVAEAVRDPAVLADQPLGRVATPEEVAQVVSFCVLRAPASLTGAILDVNGASYLRN
jgi:3-oxoacyl-[acyl-carrier protein] reductase